MSKEVEEEILQMLTEVKDDVIETKDLQRDYHLMIRELVASIRELYTEVKNSRQRIDELEAQVAEQNERIARLEKKIEQREDASGVENIH
ncbi:hypothetical protein [Heliorestis convoluta]|uniref:Uncharacterized protein n=1 Tax=Heliorestis convoluta TaxID=356322 RepID=A0A5Q2MWG7_9FIRM|nr:hypothetical protein [Heliorestis convoluta]QGG46738.1 hypothetical protein FTV88_0559 [Heliorestis convoluta]